MLTAVEAVTSTSQWQLPLFNTWRQAGGRRINSHRSLSHMYICQIDAAVLCVYGLSDKPVNPSSPSVWIGDMD